MDTAPKIVLQNPYRILGVYANAAKKDIVANKGKATAFLKVNKSVEYPLDLKGILPAPKRTLDLMNEAEAHLAIAKEQIKYAQFWFLKMTSIDDVAFNYLIAGNLSEAKDFWSKQESLSSLQNKLVCYLIENKPWPAVKLAEKLYLKYGDAYINKVDANCTLRMTGTELLHLFIDTLGEEIGVQKLLVNELGAETKAYIRFQAIDPLINKISSEVDRAKRVDRKNSQARIMAGRELVTNTKEAFTQLKSILPTTDSQYQMIADKLGLEILQCAIDYFNNSEDDDAPHTAMKMQKYAQSVVVGTLAKQRCEENVKILQKIIDELPPKKVIAEDKAIKKELEIYQRLAAKIHNAKRLLNNTRPYLQTIKQKLGQTDAYYLKLSTIVVSSALHYVVEEVNEVQQSNVVELPNGGGTINLDALMSPADRIAKYNRIKDTLCEAWNATIIMDDFDMEYSFKSHYNQNRSTLKTMCIDLGISTSAKRQTTTSHSSSKTNTVPPYKSTSVASSGVNKTTKAKNSSKINKKEEKELDSIWVALLIAIFVHILWGLLVNAMGGDFWKGFFWGGILGWVFYINVLLWALIYGIIRILYKWICKNVISNS